MRTILSPGLWTTLSILAPVILLLKKAHKRRGEGGFANPPDIRCIRARAGWADIKRKCVSPRANTLSITVLASGWWTRETTPPVIAAPSSPTPRFNRTGPITPDYSIIHAAVLSKNGAV